MQQIHYIQIFRLCTNLRAKHTRTHTHNLVIDQSCRQFDYKDFIRRIDYKINIPLLLLNAHTHAHAHMVLHKTISPIDDHDDDDDDDMPVQYFENYLLIPANK